MCIHMYVHICKDQKLIPSIFLRHSLPYVLRQVLLLSLSARLVNKRPPATYLSPHPFPPDHQPPIPRFETTIPSFYVGSEDLNSASSLNSKHFSGAISPAPVNIILAPDRQQRSSQLSSLLGPSSLSIFCGLSPSSLQP